MAASTIALAPEIADLLELSMPELTPAGAYRIEVDDAEPDNAEEFAASLGMTVARVSDNGGSGWPVNAYEGDLLSMVAFLGAYNGTPLVADQIVEIARRITAAN